MRKLIGIVSEGPTDYMILKSVIDRITGENNRYLSLQPEKDMLGRYGNGWKGVWRWCKETESVKMLMEGIQPSIAITIPCDSTDAWVVASYESEIDDIEKFENPWKNVISKGKYYHGIRVRGEKKSTITYALFTGNVAEKWNLVTEKCISARIFEHDIKRMLL